ncbi:MAG: filamentous hemagglutinin N-terminal domain-containing protein, partial [Pseudomonadales bacterium]|nr:filamentous hemagglutinin N-terminal domain-containing protein [Pseudomonadales bacterium]
MLQRGLVATGIAGSLLFAPLLQAAPEGGVVIDGEGTVTHVDDMTTHIDQMTQNLLMEFESFDLSADESVLITQPNASAWFVGNVVGGSPTAIFGNITANGQVALVNASGVIFGETASINAAGVFASALDINTEDLVNGEAVNFEAKPGSGGFVINHGLISASVGGSVTLLGQSVTNSGVIMATLGQVNLAAGSRAVVNFGPEQLIGIEVTQEVLENNEGLRAAINNTGTIDAEGGAVMLTSSVSKSLFDYAINNEGVVKAKTARLEDGVIKLTGRGSSVLNMGVLDASAEAGEGDGGSISVSSDQAVMLGSGSAILTDSKGGVAGSIDVSGDAITVADRASVSASGALGGGEIQLAAGSALAVELGASLAADATVEGDGGLISMAGDDVQFAGTATARGGAVAGDGGTVTITARDNLDFSGVIDVSAPQGDVGELIFNVESVSIEEDDQIRASALEAVQGDIEINATGRVELADLGGDTLDLGGNALTINVDGVALSAAESDAIGFFMQGAADTLTTRGQVTVAVTDGSVNANALIDIAGRVESTPVPDPLPNEPQNPGNSIAMTANQGRIRIRDTAELDVSGDDNAGAITLTATGFDEETESGTVFFNGSIDATSDSGVGGTVKLLGDRVGLFGEASIDASGALGGGEILVGGNYQGKGPELNAQQTVVGSHVTLFADATSDGDGGTVIIWSDGRTFYDGEISARGVGTGDGGFAEVSGKLLEFHGGVNLGSENGSGGQLLLDPENINIVGTGTTTVSETTTGMFDAPGATGTSVLVAGDIEAHLNDTMSTSVTIQATGDVTLMTDITVDSTNSRTLTIDAGGSIIFDTNGRIVDTTGNGILNVSLNALGSIDANNTGLAIDIEGNLVIDAVGFIGTSANTLDIDVEQLEATTSQDGIFINATGDLTIGGANLQTSGGNAPIELTLGSGNLELAGMIVTDGTGSVTLDVSGAIVDSSLDNSGVDISTNALTIDSAGSVGSSTTDALNLTVGSLTITSSSGDVFLTETNGLSVGTLSAGANTVSLAVTTGDITDNTSSISAGSLTLSTGSGEIGSGTTSLSITATTLDASATTGIYLDETDGVTVAGLSATGTISLSAGTITTTGTIGSGGGAITLTADDGITLGGDVTAAGGQIDIDADFDNDTTGTFAIGTGTHTVSTTGSAVINVIADDVSLDASASITAVNGDITLAPSTAVTIGLGTGAGAFNLSNAELGDITTTGSLVVGDATSGNITADEVDVVGQDLSLV